jgi:hypothetical protein
MGSFKTVDHFLMHITGPNSDHGDPIVLKLRFGCRKNTAPPKRSKPRIAWHKLDNPEIAAKFKDATIENSRSYSRKPPPHSKLSQRRPLCKSLKNIHLRQTHNKRMFCGVQRGPNTLIIARNQANDLLKEDSSEYNRIVFCKERSLLNRETQCAKNRLA